MYAVVDVETTGGSPVHEKITEIAVYLHDGNQVVAEFSTLLNPEKIIPVHITQLTGITNEMVADAPKFYQIARHLVEMTEGCIFVAHNVNFDYQFIRNEFLRLGYDYQREKLCTVRLSRRLLPGKKSYSLGNLCQELNIGINGRHRAPGDAYATAQLLGLLLRSGCNDEILEEISGISMKGLHPLLDRNIFKTLPEEPGIYYFYNDKNDIIYIGKSRNIHQRVCSHFAGKTTVRGLKMREQVADISYELTGNELVALLLESDEIKKHRPAFNRAQRKPMSSVGLYSYTNPGGYLCFQIERTKEMNNAVPLDTFNSKAKALEVVNRWIDRYHLCQKLCGVYDSTGACFHYEIRECLGACIGKEPPALYNQRAELLVRELQYQQNNMLIIDKGRTSGERSVIRIENGKYTGFGFVDFDSVTGTGTLHDCIQTRADNHDVRYIIRSYLRHHETEKIIRF